LISASGQECLRQLLSQSPLLLAFDLDGTLAPLVARPEDAAIPTEVMQSLEILEKKSGLAILSGRGRADIQRLGRPLSRAHFIGNHGLEHPGVPASVQQEASRICRDWVQELRSTELFQEAGLFLEDKGSSVSLHYRQTENPNAARRRIEQATSRLTPAPKLIAGKFVINLTPQFAPLKGDALEFLQQELGARGILFAGDDITDEHAFRWIRKPPPGVLGLGVHVGSNPDTQAQFRLASVSEVSTLLKNLAQRLS